MRRHSQIALVTIGALLAAGQTMAGPQSFQIKTDARVYQPGESIQVTFKYHVESGTPLVTGSQSGLGCHYFVWLVEKDGTIVASAGGQGCDFSLDCEEQKGPIMRTIDLPLPIDLDCGIYSVQVKTGYNLTTPDHPDGIGLGSQAFLPVVICEDLEVCS
jgi:hypothetical protein